MNEEDDLQKYDHWLKDDSEYSAIVLREWLEPVEGKDAIIFPPTYIKREGMKDSEWTGYNIDLFSDGTSVCQIDSVGSQANRIEPVFKSREYSKLVPQVIIKAGKYDINLLDVGHRAADALVRFSELRDELNDAYLSFLRDGNAEPLAKIAPTSIVFGSWDSRDTQAKLPRVVRSVIRAFNVQYLHRSATYIPPVDYVGENLVKEPNSKDEQRGMSEVGLVHNPSSWTHGGVRVLGEIRRDAALNLSAIRVIKGSNEDALPIRRYIFGLSLVSFTAPQNTFLREGCQLVPDRNHPTECYLVKNDGNRVQLGLSHGEALEYARRAASSFGVGNDRKVKFDPKFAEQELSERKGRKKKETESPAE